MKIKCVKHSLPPDHYYYDSLTIGKIYDSRSMIHPALKEVLIINNYGAKIWYPNECFVAVDEWRNKLLEKILLK